MLEVVAALGKYVESGDAAALREAHQLLLAECGRRSVAVPEPSPVKFRVQPARNALIADCLVQCACSLLSFSSVNAASLSLSLANLIEHGR